MECPECGYVLSPFELDCPRCRREEDRGSREAELSLPARSLEAAREVARSFEVVPWFGRLAVPELGATLTLLLGGAILLNLLLVVLCMLAAAAAERNAELGEAARYVAIFFKTLTIGPTFCLVGAIGMLRLKRWGFFLFHSCALAPLALLLVISVLGLRTLWVLVLIIPTLTIFTLAMQRWDEFE